MKTYFKYIILGLAFSLSLVSCDGDDSLLGGEIFNEDTSFPFVSIFDLNEDLEGIEGNNAWDFILTPEAEGNQVRILYDTQDPNIIDHQVFVGFDSNDGSAPLESDSLIATITTFPAELVFTRADVAAALNVPVADLETGSVFFRGTSRDADDNVVEDPSTFELFLTFERHAYFYEWPLAL